MPKKIWLFSAISYTLVLTIFSLINIDSLPKLGSGYDDKLFHVLAYGLLIFMWHLTLHKIEIVKSVLTLSVFVILYGIVLEVLQEILTSARKFDIIDILANSIGVAIVSLFIIIRNKTIVKNL